MFKKILITADLGHLEDAEKAVKTALEMTKHNPDTVYRVMSVVPPLGSSFVSSFLPKNFDQDVLDEANKALHAFTKKHFPEGAKVQHILAHGPVYEEINRIAKEKNIDLIIMMAVRDNKEGLSSNTVKVARYSDKPILILR
ncbi:universal stress protein [Pasteurella canis]|uniref:UspA domain-containing protein n=1 Tax=Pasteurella canis TaxID=753 RepID=A0A379EU83_9PAST|nr:universal stress protein [Pasteurella canis]MXN87573.1 universal stress protein [Pasteurella canis]UAX42716.1 universal stress protein [Pasteurella canis]UAY78221.1 universal stress protein [Pasteurella canis]UDW84296.1 universal stress protein [Pasteurella canis]UEC23740.1 universal stress protein [Pasteurella canis]